MNDGLGSARKAPCGHGYDGMCCCTCGYQLIAKPRCHHLGGKGKCGDNLDILGARSTAIGALASEAVDVDATFVCLLFTSEGIVMTDWPRHSVCECWFLRDGEYELTRVETDRA